MVVTKLELIRMRSENVRSSFSAASIIFGSVIGFLIADGLGNKSITISNTVLLAVWFFCLAGVPQLLLRTAENIVWHVPWKDNFISLICVAVPAITIGFFQETIPIDDKVWTALIPCWIISTLFVAILERPTSKELLEYE